MEICKSTYFEEQQTAAFLESVLWEHFFRSELSQRNFWWLAAQKGDLLKLVKIK